MNIVRLPLRYIMGPVLYIWNYKVRKVLGKENGKIIAHDLSARLQSFARNTHKQYYNIDIVSIQPKD